MAAPKERICFQHCEKEVFDAKNAKIVPPIGVPAGAPALTPAQELAITQDIERQFKGEIETVKCGKLDKEQIFQPDEHCSCNYGAQPPWPNNYDIIKRSWKVEVPKPAPAVGKFTYNLQITVDTASVTVSGKCKQKPAAVLPPGKTTLP